MSEETYKDAKRYQRLRILGAAPFGSEHLENASVMRFTNLDAFVDKDISLHSSRGESPPASSRTDQASREGSTKGDWYCRNCGYLSSSRVTFSETCDTCHHPVEFHTVQTIDALTHANTEMEKMRVKVQQYEAAFHLAAHDAIFISEEDASCFFRPINWLIEEGKTLQFFGNLNDTFGYACADAEEMTLEECLEVYKDACNRFPDKPWIAVALWAQKKCNGMPFIEPVQKMVDAAIAALPPTPKAEGDFMAHKILPCRFCYEPQDGFSGLTEDAFGRCEGMFSVCCENKTCGVTGPMRPTMQEAIDSWNGEPLSERLLQQAKIMRVKKGWGKENHTVHKDSIEKDFEMAARLLELAASTTQPPRARSR